MYLQSVPPQITFHFCNVLNSPSVLKEATHVQLQEVRKVNEEQKIDLTLSHHSFTPLSDVDCCSLKLSDFIEIAISDAARQNVSACILVPGA